MQLRVSPKLALWFILANEIRGLVVVALILRGLFPHT